MAAPSRRTSSACRYGHGVADKEGWHDRELKLAESGALWVPVRCTHVRRQIKPPRLLPRAAVLNRRQHDSLLTEIIHNDLLPPVMEILKAQQGIASSRTRYQGLPRALGRGRAEYLDRDFAF